MSFGNFGFSEILIIAVLVLIFFGPRRMPEIGRALGGAMREFRRGLNEIQRELQEAERAAKIDPDIVGTKSSPNARAGSKSPTGSETPAARAEPAEPAEPEEPARPSAPTPLAAALASPSEPPSEPRSVEAAGSEDAPEREKEGSEPSG